MLTSFGLDSNFSFLSLIAQKKHDLFILGYVSSFNLGEYPREIIARDNFIEYF